MPTPELPNDPRGAETNAARSSQRSMVGFSTAPSPTRFGRSGDTRRLQRRVRAVGHRDREARVRRRREAGGPAPEHRIDQPVPVAPELPLPAERQVVAPGEREDVPRIVGRGSVVGLDVVAVLRVGALAGHAAIAEVAGVVRHRLAPRVVGDEIQPVPQPLLERRLQPVVVGPAARRRRADRLDQRVERVERTPLLHRQPRRRIAGARQRLVAVDRRHQLVDQLPT